MFMSAELKALANKLISNVSEMVGVHLQFDEESVKWLDGYIERIRPNVDESSIEGVSNSVGAFPGECIIANYGGIWAQSEEGDWGASIIAPASMPSFSHPLRMY